MTKHSRKHPMHHIIHARWNKNTNYRALWIVHKCSTRSSWSRSCDCMFSIFWCIWRKSCNTSGLRHWYSFLKSQHICILLILIVVHLFVFPFSMIMLCNTTQDAMMYYRVSLSHHFAGPLTIANRAWRTPHAPYIVPHSFLNSGEISLLISLWIWNSLHKSGAKRVDSICKIVSHVVLVTIHLEFHLRCCPCNKSLEECWSLETLMSIREPGRPKKKC